MIFPLSHVLGSWTSCNYPGKYFPISVMRSAHFLNAGSGVRKEFNEVDINRVVGGSKETKKQMLRKQ